MQTSNRNPLVLIAAAAAALSLAACDTRSNTDTVGQKIDRAGDKIAAETSNAANQAAAAIDDTAITTKVKAAIVAEPGLKSLQIDVDTKQAVVTLSGTVDNAALKDRAKQVAQSVSGVQSVVDKLTTKTSG